ncbi:growth/differentiation factor [Salinibacterium sp. PAMC 21357]|uniref:growth/differentiation factor n=1 Tax=Salinibacterium sp. PAMC 21357 TaxID=1112215 RepID=UPI0011479436|nr:growth/differentiation factor [Salinibacterium sp. PAMC 21357]
MAESSQIIAASSSDDGFGGFGLVFLLSGFIFYAVIYVRYRNVDKRHNHESETESAMFNMQEANDFVASKSGLTNSKIDGANNDVVRGARRKFF